MGSLSESKSPQKGTEVPWRLHLQDLLVAFLHGRLQKVRVMLRLKKFTECVGFRARIRVSEADVQTF